MNQRNHRPRFGRLTRLFSWRKIPARNLLLIFNLLSVFVNVALAANALTM